jgi:hypothetical protein
MTTRDIPRDQWRRELDAFSRQHEGWIVDVAVSGADGRVLTEARDLPLQGVSADAPQSDRIAIMAGERPDDHVTHEVDRAVAVAIETTDAGAERGLRIDAADGSITRVESRTPMRPEEVDGVPRQ